MWFLAVNDRAEVPQGLPESPSGWTVTFVDQQGLAAAASDLCPGCEVRVIADAADIDVPGGWSMVLGAPAFVERALRRVMGMPDGTARLAVRPGALSLVQLLPDRAILVHLNQGRALDVQGA